LNWKNVIVRGLLIVVGVALIAGAGAIGWRVGKGYGIAFMASLLVLVIFLTAPPPSKVQDVISTALVPLTALTFVGTGLGIGLSERTGTVRFYEIAAQVIPTLVLALTLEIRLIRGRPTNPFSLVFPAIILVAVGLGEFAALKAVLTGRPTPLDFQSVVVALATAFIGVFLGALARPPGTDSQGDT
jgi:hypothetical protein